MEANKEQAELCCQLAKSAFNEGDLEKAIRLFKKSVSMYPTPESRRLLQKAEVELTTRNRVRERRAAPSTPKATGEEAPQVARPFTPKQEREIDRIIKYKHDYYAVLNCTKESTKIEIERNYKKVALIIHPDKNSHPRAVEAIKTLNEAKECLSDPRSKEIYDFTGRNPAHGNNTPSRPSYAYARNSPYAYARNNPYGEDPIFQFFFNSPGVRSHFNSQHVRQRQRAERVNQKVDSFMSSVFVLLISALFIFFFFTMSISGKPYPPKEAQFQLFQFNPSTDYPEKKVTSNGVIYYQKSHLARGTNRVELENNVDQAWLEKLRVLCSEAQEAISHNEKLAESYRYYNDDYKMYKERAESISTKHCDELEMLKMKLYKGRK